MSSVLYGYIRKVKGAQPHLWKLSSAAPLGARLGSFVCLSIGLGMAFQIPPKVQIPFHFVGNGNNNNIGAGEIQATSSSLSVPAAISAENNKNVEAEGGGGWKVRCPFDFTDNKDTTSPVHGLERITRHPGLWSFGLLGLGNALLVPSLPQRAWLVMPMMVAIVGGAHTDSRFRRGMGGTLSKEYDEATSNVPFVALLSGAQGKVSDVLSDFVGNEVKPLNAMIAVGLSGLWVLRKGRGVKIPIR